jgi:hypothetical protein
VREFGQTGNMNIPTRVHRSTVVIKTCIAEVSERLSVSRCGNIHNKPEYHTLR